VRSFSSADKVTAPDPAKLAYAPEWVPPPMRLSTAEGMHRFVWDLRYPPPAVPASNERPASGVWAPPGQYRIELGVNGRHYRQPLRVLPDPRVHVSEAALQREFVLARKVQDATVRSAAASAEATRLLKALDARRAHADGSLRAQIETLLAKATDLSGVQLHPDPRNTMGSPPRRTDSLRALSMDLAKLGQAVDGADADPGTDALASYASLSDTLTATLDAWNRLKQDDLAALDRALKAAGQKPIDWTRKP